MNNLLGISGLIILSILLNSCKMEIDNTIKDIDGNSYSSVTIGTQVWMKENLNTTRYQNGDFIETTSPADLDISSETAPKYQWAYNGNERNVITYGRLYTWSVVTDNRNICPIGWHVPAINEWVTLIDYLTNKDNGLKSSGSDIAKSMAAQSGWIAFPVSGTIGYPKTRNSSGFTGLPGGYRHSTGEFNSIGLGGYWWSSTLTSTTDARSLSMRISFQRIIKGSDSKTFGFSVRCLQD